jgi:hypothetical protein
MFPGTAPPGTQAFSIIESAGPTPVPLDNLTFGGNTNGSLISPGVLTLSSLAASTGITKSQPLLSLQMDVRQSSTVIPEPAMLPLMGIGLLGLGLMGRRRAQK